MEIAFKTHDEIREFQYRLGATDAVVRLWISKLKAEKDRTSLSKEWNALQRIIKEDSQDRNRISHFSIGPEVGSDGSTKWYVCPYFQFYSHLSYYSSGEENIQLPPGTRKFDIESMNAKAGRFLSTAERIDKFISDLRTHGAQLSP